MMGERSLFQHTIHECTLGFASRNHLKRVQEISVAKKVYYLFYTKAKHLFFTAWMLLIITSLRCVEELQ